jgi:hypothetical protein
MMEVQDDTAPDGPGVELGKAKNTMQVRHIRQTLRAAGTVIAMAAVALTVTTPRANATGSSMPPIQGLSNPILPNNSPSANPMQGYQGYLPSVPYGHATLPDLSQSTKWFCYFDYFRGWGYMRVDYVKYNWHTGSKLMCVRLYHLDYSYGFPYWVESKGSGSEYNGLYTFSLDRQADGLGQLYFEGRSYEWNTYHPVGDPDAPRWFYIQPF